MTEDNTFYDYKIEVARHIRTCVIMDDYTDITRGCKTLEDVENKVREEIWKKGEVTGRDCGFYTDYVAAQTYLAGNFGLLENAIIEVGDNKNDWRKAIEDPAWGDVLVRCYVFEDAFIHVISDYECIDILKGYCDVSSPNRRSNGNAPRKGNGSKVGKISSTKGKSVKRTVPTKGRTVSKKKVVRR